MRWKYLRWHNLLQHQERWSGSGYLVLWNSLMQHKTLSKCFQANRKWRLETISNQISTDERFITIFFFGTLFQNWRQRDGIYHENIYNAKPKCEPRKKKVCFLFVMNMLFVFFSVHFCLTRFWVRIIVTLFAVKVESQCFHGEFVGSALR